jgi:iron-sulfur cluster assembly protein
MMGGGFTIDNPNAIASCGCGSSFVTATNKGTPENC